LLYSATESHQSHHNMHRNGGSRKTSHAQNDGD
jgi:hypothetical protein